MKRFLSWIVLWVCGGAFNTLQGYFWSLALSIYAMISSWGATVSLIVTVLSGVIAIAVIVVATFYAVKLSAVLSDSVDHSETGKRYRVFSIVLLIIWAMNVFNFIMGTLVVASAFVFIASAVTIIAFAVLLMMIGKQTADKHWMVHSDKGGAIE